MRPVHRVSIVEDDESLREALVGLVRSLGHEAHGYASAEQFLDETQGDGGDCLITDIQLPGLSGIELMQRLLAAGDAIPTIVITARTDRGLDERAMANGALCVLKKPFDTKLLVERLEETLSSDQ